MTLGTLCANGAGATLGTGELGKCLTYINSLNEADLNVLQCVERQRFPDDADIVASVNVVEKQRCVSKRCLTPAEQQQLIHQSYAILRRDFFPPKTSEG